MIGYACICVHCVMVCSSDMSCMFCGCPFWVCMFKGKPQGYGIVEAHCEMTPFEIHSRIAGSDHLRNESTPIGLSCLVLLHFLNGSTGTPKGKPTNIG